MEYCDIESETPFESKEDTDENNTPKDLSSPNPCLTIKEMTKEKIFRISYLDNYYLLIISNIIDKYLSLELIPEEGNLPYSYKVTYNMQILNSIEYIFKDLKTIDECMKRIISILPKKRISIFRDAENDLFYVVLKITIIDEDKYIPLKLTCTNNIQICTIRYIYNEITNLREKYNQYKKEKLEQINKQQNEIKILKEINKKYLKIINKLKYKNDKEYQNKKNELKFKLENLEQNIIYHKLKFKCDIIKNHKIIIFHKRNSQKSFDFKLTIKNIGNSFLSTKYDKIYFEKDKNLSSKEIDLKDKNDSIININGLFKPNDILELNLKFKLTSKTTELIFNYYANIYSIKHGLISIKPLIIQALIIPDNIKEIDLLNYLKNNFELNMKGNNLYLYDEQKYIIKKIFSLEKDEDNKNENINLFNKEKENEYQNEFFERNIDDEKYTNIYKEIKEFLDNNKDIKINEEEIKKIIEN